MMAQFVFVTETGSVMVSLGLTRTLIVLPWPSNREKSIVVVFLFRVGGALDRDPAVCVRAVSSSRSSRYNTRRPGDPSYARSQKKEHAARGVPAHPSSLIGDREGVVSGAVARRVLGRGPVWWPSRRVYTSATGRRDGDRGLGV